MVLMLNTFRKFLAYHKVLNIDFKNLVRAVTGDRSIVLNEETLTGRFLLYLDNNKSSQDASSVDKFELIASLKAHPANIRTFDVGRVSLALNSLNDRGIVHNKNEFNKMLHLIDSECCNRVNYFDIESQFKFLNMFMKVIPHQIVKSQYFHAALEKLITNRHELEKDHLIHLMFYIGLLKKNRNAQNMMRKCLKLLDLNNIKALTKEDICIICNSSFKTSTKISNILFLDKIKSYINDNLYLLNDPAVFVTLIKTLRHNGYQDDDIMSTITCTIFFNRTLESYSFGAMCHILALYADYLYYNENILDAFTKQCLKQLADHEYSSKDAYLMEQPRTKDIKRFLWALSNLNYKLEKEDIEGVVLPQILVRVEAGEFKNDPGSLVQIILYLWMMQYKASNLIREFLTKDIVDYIQTQKLPSQDSLNLLLTCIFYEDTELFQSLKVNLGRSFAYNLDFQLRKRSEFKKIVENLKTVATKNNIDKYEVTCQVPYINIVGITGFQKNIYKMVNVEVLDEYTCLKNTDNKPTGLMQLKLRILDKCDEGLIIIDKRDILDYSDAELQQMLEEEVSLVC